MMHTLGIRILIITTLSSFKPKDTSYKFKDNSLRLRVNKLKHKDLKPRPNDS